MRTLVVPFRIGAALSTWCRAILILIVCLTVASGPARGATSDWTFPLTDYTLGCCRFMYGTGGCASSCSDHLGIDYLTDYNASVRSISYGYDLKWWPSIGGFGGCNESDTGGLLWVKHRKSNGDYFWAMYGHVFTPTYTSMPSGRLIQPGEVLVKINHYDPCCISGGDCPHLHFAIWDADGSLPTTHLGYGTQRSFVDPAVFLQSWSPYPENQTYVCQIGAQSGGGWGKPGATLDLWIEYKNIGTATWTKSGGVSDPELHSVTGAWPCAASAGCAYASSWPSTQRICSFSQSAVAPNATARYAFQGTVPASGTCDQWIAPWEAGTCVDGWATPGGAYFELKADGAAPSASIDAGSDHQPGTYQSDITIPFTVSDSQSGVYGFAVGWDGGFGATVQSSHGSTTLGAAGAGSHELWVRVWDNSQPLPGNTADRYLGTYVYSGCPGGPCPGRYIPNTCVSASTCCPAQGANVQRLANLTLEQWRRVGQPTTIKLAGKFSVGFEYQAQAPSVVAIGLGGFNALSGAQTVSQAADLPASAGGEWRTFWSAPFTVTAEQLRANPNLRIVPSGPAQGLEIRNVRVVAYQ